MSGLNTGLNRCLICGTDNHIPTGGDQKIIFCRRCGAPVYDSNRPAQPNDFANYRNKLAQWGEDFRETRADELEKQGKKVADRHQNQTKEAALNEQIRTFQNEAEDWQNKHRKLEDRCKESLSQYKERYENALKQQADAQNEVQDWQNKYRRLQNQYSSFQKKLSKLLNNFQHSSQQTKQFVNEMEASFTSKWKEFKAVEANADGSVVRAIEKLLADKPVEGKDLDSWEDADEKRTEAVPSGRQRGAKEDASGDNQSSNPPSSKTPSAEEYSKDSSAMASSATAVANNTSQAPDWLSEYNQLSLEQARSFRERHQARRLTIPQNSLENQRIALDGAKPSLIEGAGSYWCIQEASTQSYFLVLDRERFRFNSSNYESITACYDFNNLHQTELKTFNASLYDLNTYRVASPALVVPVVETGEWKLHSRGRLLFQEKPTS